MPSFETVVFVFLALVIAAVPVYVGVSIYQNNSDLDVWLEAEHPLHQLRVEDADTIYTPKPGVGGCFVIAGGYRGPALQCKWYEQGNTEPKWTYYSLEATYSVVPLAEKALTTKENE